MRGTIGFWWFFVPMMSAMVALILISLRGMWKMGEKRLVVIAVTLIAWLFTGLWLMGELSR